MSSDSIPMTSKTTKQHKKWWKGRKKAKSTLVQSDLVQTGESHSTDANDAKISQNWRVLSQTLGLSSGRRVFLPGSRQSRGQGSSGSRVVDIRNDPPPVARQSSSRTRIVEIHDSPSVASPSAADCIALDCEMVGGGEKGRISMLARCSVVNHHGDVMLDTYVAPVSEVTDYRTRWSGIRAYNLIGAPSFSRVQSRVAEMMRGKTVVGHAIKNDLQALQLHHPKESIRDTSLYKPFKEMFGGKMPSLKNLAGLLLRQSIQQREHDSVQDARATMSVYQLHKRDWEKSLTHTGIHR